MDVQRQTYAQTVEYDVCRSYIIAASFQLFNAMVLALDQCANFNSALCLWSFHGVVRDFENRWGRFLKAVPAVWLSANHYLEQAPLSPARQEDRVPLSSGPMTGAQQWEKKSAQNSATTQLLGNTLKCSFRAITRHYDKSVRCPLCPDGHDRRSWNGCQRPYSFTLHPAGAREHGRRRGEAERRRYCKSMG